jgi:hypothetical protein
VEDQDDLRKLHRLGELVGNGEARHERTAISAVPSLIALARLVLDHTRLSRTPASQLSGSHHRHAVGARRSSDRIPRPLPAEPDARHRSVHGVVVIRVRGDRESEDPQPGQRETLHGTIESRPVDEALRHE